MGYKTEKFYPVVFGVAFAIFFFFFHSKLKDIDLLMGKLADATVVVSATFIGFFLTITTILSSIATRRMKFIKDQKGYSQVVGYLHNAIWLNMAAVAVSIIFPFIQKSVEAESCLLLYVIQIFILTWAWAASFRFSYLFLRIMGGEE